MGKVYKDKKGSSCKMCKPHKTGWAPKQKYKEKVQRELSEKEMKEKLNKN